MKKVSIFLFLIFSSGSWSQTYEEKVAASRAFIGKPVQEHTFYTIDKLPITFQSLKVKMLLLTFSHPGARLVMKD